MDNETWGWIVSQNPNYKDEPLKIIMPKKIAAALCLPLPNWFFVDSRIIGSIHGVRHARRVAYYCFLIATTLDFDKTLIEKLVMAGLLHDIRRENDKGDPGHGTASAEWFMVSKKKIEKSWDVSFTETESRMIFRAIGLHEAPYSEITEDSYDEFNVAVDILKTADALDRYRLPKQKWWINDQYLRYIPPDWLKQTAYNLVVLSESVCLKTGKIDCVNNVILGGEGEQ